MTGDEVKRRHVWVGGAGGHRYPGLVIAWRRAAGTHEWEAYVAQVHRDGTALVTWEPVANLHPVTDDQQQVDLKGWRR